MQEHYQLSDEEFSFLLKDDVGINELYNCLRFFDPNKSMKPISGINLFYALDIKGSPFKKPFTSWKLIFKCLYKKLPVKEKLEINKYLEDLDDKKF